LGFNPARGSVGGGHLLSPGFWPRSNATAVPRAMAGRKMKSCLAVLREDLAVVLHGMKHGFPKHVVCTRACGAAGKRAVGRGAKHRRSDRGRRTRDPGAGPRAASPLLGIVPR
jgi:hypothetical protein